MANKDFKVKNGLDIQTPLPVSMGGTGQTSTTNTLNSLLPPQSGNTNKVLQTDGTNTQWYRVPAAYTRGGTASRPASPTAGDLFFNTDKKAFEVYNGTSWISLIANGAVPLPPTIGTATVSGLTASVPFTGPADFGDAAISSYTVTPSPSTSPATFSNASSPIAVTGLTANTTYTFTVTATNSYGTSNASSASNSITTATTPGAPTSVTAVGTGVDGQALVSWTAPASNGGSAITDYTVQYSSNSGSSWTTFSDGTSTSTSATVTGLTTGTAYIFRVAAVNVIGTGSYSTASSSFTPVSNDPGAMIPISMVTLSSATQTINFTNIPSNYTHLQLRCFARSTSANNTIGACSIRFNNDSNANYSNMRFGTFGTGTFADAEASQTSAGGIAWITGSTAASGIFGAWVTDIFDYASTTKNKTMRTQAGVDFTSGGWAALTGNLYVSSSAISQIAITCGDGNFTQHSSFALYGVKSA